MGSYQRWADKQRSPFIDREAESDEGEGVLWSLQSCSFYCYFLPEAQLVAAFGF